MTLTRQPKSRRQSWGGSRSAAAALTVITGAAAASSWKADPAALPSAVRLDAGWMFHAAFAVVAFCVLFVIASLVTLTVRAGGPPTKLTLGAVSYEAATVEALSDGAASLDGVHGELRMLNARVGALTDVVRTTHAMVATNANPALRRRADQQLDELARVERESAGAATEAAAAAERFHSKLAALHDLHAEMTHGR